MPPVVQLLTRSPFSPFVRDLNRLVMDYLVIEGYKSAAEHFSRESGLKPNVDLDSIENRRIIRNAIQGGRIEEAIERVNELNPEVRLSPFLAHVFRPRRRARIRLVLCTTLRLLRRSLMRIINNKLQSSI